MRCGQFVVSLQLLAPVAWAEGDTCTWMPWADADLADAQVYGCLDLRRVLTDAGRSMALRLHAAAIEGFRIVAMRKGCQRVTGASQWARSASGLLYQPPALMWSECDWGHVRQQRAVA